VVILLVLLIVELRVEVDVPHHPPGYHFCSCSVAFLVTGLRRPNHDQTVKVDLE